MKTPKEELKANVWDKLKDLGVERFNNVKDSLSDTVTKLKDKDDGGEKTTEKVIHNNPFKKIQQQKNSNI